MNRFILSIGLIFTFAAVPTFAQDGADRVVEEVVVTGLRKESSLQDTAITITAITSADLETKQLENFEDLQFAVPTLTFAKGAYSGSGISLRGIGNFAVGNSSSSSIGYFWNGQVGSQSGLYEAEFFDVERVEVLRGPQGTLFGSGTSGGAVQLITKRPGAEFGGSLKVDLADYDSTRINGAVDIPFSDNFRSRFAFASLKRDGFVTNNYNGDQLDDRNTMAGRASFEWDFSDDTSITLIYEQTKADDNRLRAARQFCKQDSFFGCDPIQTGMDSVHSSGSYFHWINYFMFTYTDLENSYNRNNPSNDVRTVDLDFTPTHNTTLESTLFEIDHALTDDVNMVFSYSYHTRDYEDWADYDHSVSVLPYALGPITTNVGVDPTTGNPGVGMRTYTSEQNIDMSTNESEWSQTELRFSSDYDGQFNFTLGFYHQTTSSETDYHIKSPSLMYYGNTNNGPHCQIFPATCNVGGLPYWGTFFGGLTAGITSATGLAQVGAIDPSAVLATGLGLASGGIVIPGVPGANAAALAALAGRTGGLPLWQQTYRNDSNMNRHSNAVYGELYYDVADDTRLTFGARYSDYEIIDYAYVGLSDLTGKAAGYFGSIQPPAEKRDFFSDATTFKLGIDHDLNDNQLIYATFSSGFKPGGTNPTDADNGGVQVYAEEEVEVFEVGMKNTLMDGRLQLNVSAYQNEIDGLQLSKIVRRSSINENASATVKGFEAEFTFFITNTLMLDGFYAHTDATIDEFMSVDPLNPGGATAFLPYAEGQTGFLKDFAPLAATCDPNVFLGLAAPSATCSLGLAASDAQLGALVKYKNTDAGMVFSSFASLCTQPYFGLDSTTLPCPVTDGVEQDLSGNRLPLSAEDNYRLGLTKFYDTSGGSYAFRVDYSFRGDTYSDTFNRPRDLIEEYDVVDLSLTYTPNNADWYVGAYVRNLSDSDHIYAKYNTDPTIGGFANGVALDPKIMGINFGMNF
jgi:outer membrane receptor protein involved in Fe transport